MMVREPLRRALPAFLSKRFWKRSAHPDDDDGLCLDVHEKGFMVEGNTTPRQVGMCVSIEPMLCLSGKFGLRLANIASMAEDGGHGFTLPAHTVDDPFAYAA